jgi:hypothetical protein
LRQECLGRARWVLGTLERGGLGLWWILPNLSAVLAPVNAGVLPRAGAIVHRAIHLCQNPYE